MPPLQLSECYIVPSRFLISFRRSSSKIPPESRCPELLANYCDMLLRKTPMSKKLSSDEIESKLKDVVSVEARARVKKTRNEELERYVTLVMRDSIELYYGCLLKEIGF